MASTKNLRCWIAMFWFSAYNALQSYIFSLNLGRKPVLYSRISHLKTLFYMAILRECDNFAVSKQVKL